MVELILVCFIVSDRGVFACKIDSGKHVHFLKAEIGKEMANALQCAACELNLYLAKKNSEFLRSDDVDIAELSKGDCPQEIKDSYMNADSFMNPTLRMHHFFDKNYQIEDVIHVLVQLPANPWKRQKVREDISWVYAEKLRDVDMSALTTHKQLEAFISSPLPIKCPTDIKRLSDECPEYFEHSEGKFVEANVFENALKRRFTFCDDGRANIPNILWWDMLIRTPIEDTASILKMPIKVGRNETDATPSIYAKQPNFLLWLNDVFVMTGEERGSTGEFGLAKEAVLSKMERMHLSMFGQMPFLFTYAAANSLVQFFVIDRTLNVYPISQLLDLKILQNRIRCVVSAINICRILNHYPPLLPRGFLPMYKKMTRDNGTVTLYEDYFLKKLSHDLYDSEAVMAIYEAIGRKQIQCAVRCHYDRQKRTLKLRPVGFTKLPSNDSELIVALICVARALAGLHALGYVHRDVCWPNILCLGDDAYILADFENAGRDGDRMPDDLLESRVLDPLVKSEASGHVYRSCHDMYQFGELIADTNDPSLKQLHMNLKSFNAEERYTAAGSLSFLSNLHQNCKMIV